MTNPSVSKSRPRQRQLLLFVLLLLLALAWANRFVQDDAFISYRYSSNLARGEGLVWNPGERIEGYTNFLWVLLISVPIYLRIDPVIASQALGLLFALGSYVSTYKLSVLILRSNAYALLIILLLGTNYTFSAYATGGLGTQMQTFFVITSIYLVVSMIRSENCRIFHLIVFSLLFSASMLSRLDSVVPFSVLFPVLFWHLLRQNISLRDKVYRAVLLLLPSVIILGTWLVWKYTYYGELLPNTYYVKVGSPTSQTRGIVYLYKFFESYFLIPFIFLLTFHLRQLLSASVMRILLAISFLWCLYVVKIGGDFMEFRFLVPILPVSFILIGKLILSTRDRRARRALIAMVFLGSVHHVSTFRHAHGIESITSLKMHLQDDGQNWIRIGKILGETFSDGISEITIATAPAGAIPYYSDLNTVDMLGLNDKWIARNGSIIGVRPGHQRLATHEYLVERNVNLVIGYPQVHSIDEVLGPTYCMDDLERFIEALLPDDVRGKTRLFKDGLLPSGARIIEIPISDTYKLTTLYFVQSSYVDGVIRQKGLKTYPISLEEDCAFGQKGTKGR